jgi:ATP-dependent Clp protease adaptor protein ClpS
MSEIAPEIIKEVEEERETAEGPLYRVIIHNDDVTPMDFVLQVLTQIFRLGGLHAMQVMYTAHFHGSAYVQTLPKSEAQQRVHQAEFAARMKRYPLRFTLEPEKG